MDYFTQRVVEGKSHDEVKWSRVGVFTTFGAVYLGCVQFVLYTKVWPMLFPSIRAFADLPIRVKLRDWNGMMIGFKQLGVDTFLHNPFIYYPFFYSLQSSMEHFIDQPRQHGDAPWDRLGSALATAKQRWQSNFV